jgi:hypothetical protein
MFNFGYLSSGHLFLHDQGCEDPWLFFEAKLVRKQKRLGNTLYSIHAYKTAYELQTSL